MKKISIYFLVFCMIVTQAVPTAYAVEKEEPTGELEVLLHFTYPHTAERDVSMSLWQNGSMIVQTGLDGRADTENEGVAVTVRPVEGMDSYRIIFSGVKQGTYSVKIEGTGFKPYESEGIEVEKYSRRLIVSDDNETFTLGDVNGDGRVDMADIEAVKVSLGEEVSSSSADLNGDGKCNVVDLAYIVNNLNAKGLASLEDTFVINPVEAVKTESLAESLKEYNQNLSENDVKKIFTSGNDEAILLQATDKITSENPVVIPVEFGGEGVQMQYVRITAPEGAASLQTVTVEYEAADGTVGARSAFVNTRYAAQAEGTLTVDESGRKIITVDLGKKVVVKSITIKIESVEGGGKQAAITNIEFYGDAVPDNPDISFKYAIKNLTATAGSEAATLRWNTVYNITGYVVEYGTERGVYTNRLNVADNEVEITGLENDVNYYFVVYAVNDSFEGPHSEEVSCMPVTNKVPDVPQNVKVVPGDGSLSLSWVWADKALSHKIYYRQEGEAQNQVADVPSGSQYMLTGLENGKNYIISISGVNKVGEGRKCAEVSGIPKKEEFLKPEGIPEHNQIAASHITNIRLNNPKFVNSSLYPDGFDANNVIDGDYTTHWTAGGWNQWGGFVVTFDKAYEMDHMTYVARLDGNNRKYPYYYSIKVWGPEDDLNGSGKELISQGTKIHYDTTPMPGGGTAGKGYAVLPFPKSQVRQIEVSTYVNNGYFPSSASELIFYEYYSLIDDVNSLFKDSLHTVIADGVTRETVESLKAQVKGANGEFYVNSESLLRDIEQAESLLDGNGITGRLIKDVNVTRNASKDSDRHFGYTLNDTQPLGVVGQAGKLITIYVEAEKGLSGNNSLTAHFTQFFGEPSSWSAAVNLTEGRNEITVPQLTHMNVEKGGSVYVSYRGEEQKIDMHVLGGTVIPLLSLPQADSKYLQDNAASVKEAAGKYIDELDSYLKTVKGSNKSLLIANSTEIELKDVMLSLPASQVQSGINDGLSSKDEKIDRLYNTLRAWQETMDVHYRVLGLSEGAAASRDRLPSSRINIRYMRMFGGAFMYAGGAHIGIGFGSCAPLMKGQPTDVAHNPGLFGWGINHEIGHVLDNSSLIYGETTNNIQSLFAQTYDGKDNTGASRLEGGMYPKIYEKVSVSAPGRASNVFVQLGMFWQLHLAYDDGEDNFGFYSRLYSTERSGYLNEVNISDLTTDEKFALLACEAAGKDLRSFFERWGFDLRDSVQKYIAGKGYDTEDRALYYLNDGARRYRLAGGEAMPQNVSLKGSTVTVDSDNRQVELVINSDAPAGSVLGYEIFRNGKPVAFTESNEYTDKVGVLNNVTLSYSVKVYDKLLHVTEIKPLGDVRIAYDGAIEGDFTITEVDGVTTIDLGSVYDICGIKVPVTTGSAVTGGAIKSIAVSADETDYTKVTFNTSTSGDSQLMYFNKLGYTDDRIWNYSARYIKIEGSIDKNAVRIIQYPGDSVELGPDSVGKLKQDFSYGDGKVIKAGTLIVTGTYRGDPAFNIIEIEGEHTYTGPEEDTEYDDDSTATDTKVMPGEYLYLSELPVDNKLSEVDNGIWIFVPEQDGDFRLPGRMRAVMYRSGKHDEADNLSKVSDTLWITVPSKDTLPWISLSGGN